jgi:hypothetical protein
MSTNNCSHDQPCGCNNDELTTLPDPCDTTECTGEECEQIIDCTCVRYVGDPIPEIGAESGDNLCEILNSLVDLGGVQGERGETGDPGPQGPTGPAGPAGPQGPIGLTGATGATGAPGDKGDPGPEGEQGIRGRAGLACFMPDVDTGWVDLDGFTFLNSSGGGIQNWPAANMPKPQVRRINRTVYFRGNAWIPLATEDSPTTYQAPTPSSSVNVQGYVTNKSSEVYTGTGGCNVDTATGSLTFNKNTRVIPTSVVPTTLDSGYSTKIIGRRRISLYNEELSATVNEGAVLNSYFNVVIDQDCKLIVGVEKDVENIPTIPIDNAANSLRFITSRIVEGQKAFQYNEEINQANQAYSNSSAQNPVPSLGGLHSIPNIKVVTTTTASVTNDDEIPVDNAAQILPGMYLYIGSSTTPLSPHIVESVDVITDIVTMSTPVTSISNGETLTFTLGKSDFPSIAVSQGHYAFSADTTQADQVGGFFFPINNLVAYLPPVTTSSFSGAPSEISKTSTSITLNCGSITTLGNGTAFLKGVCWAEGVIINPTVNEDYLLSTAVGLSIGNLTVTDLQPNTSYRFKSFVVTESGVHYSGISLTITTNP